MEVGEQHGDLKTCCLEIDELVDRDEVAKMDLAAWLISRIHLFLRLREKCTKVIFRDDLDSIPGNTLVRVH